MRNIHIEGQKLEQFNQFNYLGSMLTSEGPGECNIVLLIN